MTAVELRALPETDAAKLSPLLRALWLDAHGDWRAAHEVTQTIDAPARAADGAWLHAYLHRKEGDTFNARYWYRKAGRQVCVSSLDEEWHSLTFAFLAR